MAQLQAGYWLKCVADWISNHPKEAALRLLSNRLSHFELTTDAQPAIGADAGIARAAVSVISRGVPSSAPAFLEETFHAAGLDLSNTANADSLFAALHTVDPRIKKEFFQAEYNSKWGSKHDETLDSFYYSVMPGYLGEYALQLTERNKPMSHFASYWENADFGTDADLLKDATLDFFVEYPYSSKDTKGAAIQVDDASRDTMSAKRISTAIDKAISQLNLPSPFHLRDTDLADVKLAIKPLQDCLQNEYFDQISHNFYQPIYKTPQGLDALQLALSPFAVVRVQRAILEAITLGSISLTDNQWTIAVIERDVPAAVLAIEDLKQILLNLLKLKGKDAKLPSIDLTVYGTTEFSSNKLNAYCQGKTTIEKLAFLDISQIPQNGNFDILLDVSILQSEAVRNGLISTALAKASFVLRSAISKKSYRGVTGSSSMAFDSLGLGKASLDGANYFLNRLLKLSILRTGQIKLFNLMSGLQSSVAVAPPASGKTTIWQLFTALQPGFALCIVPSLQLGKEIAIRLEATGNDDIIVLDQDAVTNQQLKAISHGGFSVLIATADAYCQSGVKAALKESANKGYTATALFVEEAQCFSVWGSDFRPTYSAAASFCYDTFSKAGSPLQIACFATSASNDVLADVQAAAHALPQQLEIDTQYASNLSFNVSEIRLNNLFYNTDAETALAAVGNRKQIAVSMIVNDNLNKTENQAPHRSLLVTAKAKGLWGVIDNGTDGLADKLTISFPDLKSSYSVVGDENTYSNFKEDINIKTRQTSLTNIANFRSSKVDLLASVSAYSNSLYRDDIDEVIANNMAASPEALLQLAYKAGRNGQKSRFTLLYSGQIIQIDEETDNGKTASTRKMDVTTDTLLLKEKLTQLYPGRLKELNHSNELLTQITCGKALPIDSILRKASDLLGFMPEYQLINDAGVYFLKLYSENAYYGTINLEFLTLAKSDLTIDKTTSDQLIKLFFNEIETNCPQDTKHYTWLFANEGLIPSPGIQTILDGLQEDQTASLSINFENAGINQIALLLEPFAAGKFTYSVIRQLALSTTDSNKFLAGLNKISSLDSIQLGLGEKVRDLFFTIRTADDTFKMVNRLQQIGVVSDYAIDASQGKIKLQIIKRNPEFYLGLWSNFLALHLTPGYQSKMIAAIDKTVMLKSILEQMVDFTYTEVYTKRLASIATVNNLIAAQVLQQGKNNECTNSLQDFFKKISTARFTLNYVQGNLMSEIQSNPKPNFNSALRIQADSRGLKDNLWHLLVSTEILIKDNPEHFVLLMINGFAGLLLQKDNQTASGRYLDNLSDGFAKMFIAEKLSQTEYLSRMSTFVNKIFEHDSSLKASIQPVLFYKHHLAWLKNFNRKFALKEAAG